MIKKEYICANMAIEQQDLNSHASVIGKELQAAEHVWKNMTLQERIVAVVVTVFGLVGLGLFFKHEEKIHEKIGQVAQRAEELHPELGHHVRRAGDQIRDLAHGRRQQPTA